MKTRNILLSVFSLTVAAVTAWAVPETYASLDEQTQAVSDKTDVTEQYVQNPSFDDKTMTDGAPTGWTFTGNKSYSKISTGAKGNNGEIAAGQNHWQVWKGTGTMSQTITNIPNGTYTMTCTLVPGTVESSYVFANDDQQILVTDTYYYSVTTVVTDGTLTIGAEKAEDGSCFELDDIKLYYTASSEDDMLEAVRLQFEALWDSYSNYIQGIYDDGYTTIANTYISEGEKWAYPEEDYTTVDQYNEAITKVKELQADAEANVYPNINKMTALLEKATIIAEEGTYAGIGKFLTVYEEISDRFADSDNLTIQTLVSDIEKLNNAIDEYNNSQEASFDNPADYTFHITASNFFNTECGMSRDEANNSNRSTWGLTTGWVNASVSSVTGDFRVGYHGNLTCYNAWSNNFTSMDIYQEITDIPNGYYSMECKGLTESGMLNDQHGYISSSVKTENTPTLTVDDGVTWETLSTDKVIVTDGKLRIGFASTSGGGANGWFCCTDFKLYYYGSAGEDDYRQAYVTAYNEKLNECRELLEYPMFLADRDSFSIAIKENSSATTVDEMIAAMAALDEAMTKAEASISAYATLQKYYDEVYLPALEAAENYETADADAKAKLDNKVKEQKAEIAALKELPSREQMDAYIAELSEIETYCDAMNIYAQGGTDYTPLVKNANLDDESGWTFNNVTGNAKTGKGASYDGSTTSRYMNSWNGTVGALQYTASQKIPFILNGKYRIKCMARVMGATHGAEGAYLYAFADGDTTNMVLKAVHNEYMEFTEDYPEFYGNDPVWCESTFGSIWSEAYLWAQAHEEVEEDERLNIAYANGGKGFGWQWITLDVEVKNHVIDFGFSCDSTITLGHTDTDGKETVAFSGTQLSADVFSLELLEIGDNSDATSIGMIATNTGSTPIRYYSVNGTIMSAPQHGMNIVKMSDGSIKKIFIK